VCVCVCVEREEQYINVSKSLIQCCHHEQSVMNTVSWTQSQQYYICVTSETTSGIVRAQSWQTTDFLHHGLSDTAVTLYFMYHNTPAQCSHTNMLLVV